jgi:hypothetical protein
MYTIIEVALRRAAVLIRDRHTDPPCHPHMRRNFSQSNDKIAQIHTRNWVVIYVILEIALGNETNSTGWSG